MVEIYKLIAFIPLLDQILDDKNKNGNVKGANSNQVYMCWNFEFVSFCLRVSDDKKNFICVISFYAAILFMMITI